jgi:uncharacterized surface protein with fasciclin (FAS1) repeats
MQTIVEIAVGNPDFSTLVAAVTAAGLVEALSSPGPFTVFAPLNSAFEKLPPGTVTTLVQNPPQLGRILKYHVVSGKFMKADLVGVKEMMPLEGTVIRMDFGKNEVKNATVVMADVEASNGVIHVIDGVILMGP